MAKLLMIYRTGSYAQKKNKQTKKQKQTGSDHLKAEIVLTDNLKLGLYNVVLSSGPTDEI